MRRLALAALAALLIAGCGGTTHARLWLTPGHAKTFSACVSSDCGPWSVTLNWQLPPFPNTTGYWLFLNGTQGTCTTGNGCVGTATSSPFTFTGSDCGVTNTLGVEAHDASNNFGPLWTLSYPSPGCPGAAPTLNTEPVVSGTVATGDALSTTNGTWNNAPTSYSYQWQDCATDGTACSNITGATSSTYTVASGDAGHTIEALVTATNGSGSSAPAGAPIVPAIDEFNGTNIDTNVWRVLNQQGDTSNSEIECYLPSQTTESGGVLTETLIDNVSTFTCPAGTPNSTNPLHYKSGAMQMKAVAFQYGTIVVRAKLGSNAGGWPAIWLLGATCQTSSTSPFTYLSGVSSSATGFYCPWPSDASDSAEIDIAENPGGQGTTSVGEFIHTGTNTSCTASGLTDTSANFHLYELDWSSTSVVFKVDGTQTCSTTTNVPTHPMFLITDVAQAAAVPSPTSNVIDYIHVSH